MMTKLLGQRKTDSALLGFHPGNSWEHNSTKSSVHVNKERTGGYANIYGTLSYSLIVKGIGTLMTKELECYMTF